MPDEQQKVSAEPDIKIHAIDGKEEFLVLACDGIWDVMTNESLCDYVRELMRGGETDLNLIAEELLDFCLRAGRCGAAPHQLYLSLSTHQYLLAAATT